jgi:hypothetical protein
MLRVAGLPFLQCVLALGYIVLKNAPKEDLKFNKWDQRRCRKEEVGGESSTFPMQSGAQSSFTSSSFTQQVHKMYTRYKYTAVPEGTGKREIKRECK